MQSERIWCFWICGLCMVASQIEGIPVYVKKCPVNDGLLNPLVGNGVSDKGESEAEEEVIGLAGNPLAADVAQLNLKNGTQADLNDCLQEYGKKPVNLVFNPETRPGSPIKEDSSEMVYLPFTAIKEEALPDKGDYFTTYDASKYNFKDKGYIIEAPSPTKENLPPTTEGTTRRPTKNKNELQKWYNAFVSVVADYV